MVEQEQDNHILKSEGFLPGISDTVCCARWKGICNMDKSDRVVHNK